MLVVSWCPPTGNPPKAGSGPWVTAGFPVLGHRPAPRCPHEMQEQPLAGFLRLHVVVVGGTPQFLERDPHLGTACGSRKNFAGLALGKR